MVVSVSPQPVSAGFDSCFARFLPYLWIREGEPSKLATGIVVCTIVNQPTASAFGHFAKTIWCAHTLFVSHKLPVVCFQQLFILIEKVTIVFLRKLSGMWFVYYHAILICFSTIFLLLGKIYRCLCT